MAASGYGGQCHIHMHGHEHEEDTDHNQRYSGGDVSTHAFGGAELPRGQCLILTPQPLMGQTLIPRSP